MGEFLSLIENLAPGLYVLGTAIVLWHVRSLWLAVSELRFAQFGLERELAQRRGGRSFTFVAVMIELMIAVWGISTFAAPTWREGLPSSITPNAGRTFQTNIPPNSGNNFDIDPNRAATEGPGILSTFAPPSTPVGTIGPSDPRVGCDPDRAWIQIPANGQYVFADTTIIGTANVEDFSKYRFEIKGVAQSNWSVYTDGERTTPVINGPLGNIVPFGLLIGEYRFRLVVFNTLDEVAASCEITIWITDPQPTATPLGAVGAQQQ
ncbi:MAG: hypothetical protein CUN55_01080 [Phototrophicales bacterium]|nr:MAG: hypothetical protein CUN55_01080 [Phototrophicales bacterium]